MDWDSDPELKQIRKEFTESLLPRARQLVETAVALERDGLTVELVERVQFISHKLAGVAESYDYETLTKISEKLDDRLDSKWDAGVGPLVEAVRFLAEAIAEAALSSADPSKFLADARWARLLALTAKKG